MDRGTIDEVTEWEPAPATSGFEGLNDLAARSFTGAVTADGMTWAFLLNGNVVGVFGGDIEAFEDTDLSAYAAPDPALPLLFTMREQGGETRAKYYTNDTPLSDADGTLSAGNFTGYVELSENVLSGDYYVVYYGGKSMSVAFVGNSRRMITGDEAFERADDEVGIYAVKEADIRVREIPDPDDGEAGSDAEATSTPGAAAIPDAEADRDAEAGGDDDAREATTGDHPTGGAAEADAAAATGDDGADATDDEVTGGAGGPDASAARTAAEPADDVTFDDDDAAQTAEPTSDVESDAAPADEAATGNTGAGESERAPGAQPGPESGEPVGPRERAQTGETAREPGSGSPAASAETSGRGAEDAEATDAGEGGSPSGRDADVFTEEERWRNAQAIPALDPEDTRRREEAAASQSAQSRSRNQSQSRRAQSQSQSQQRSSRPTATQQSPSQANDARESQPGGQSPPRQGVDAEVVEKLKQKLQAARRTKEKLEAERDDLRAERDRLERERDEVETERDEYRQEAERLADRVESLESQVASLESRLEEAGVTTAERSMSAGEALDGTNLFVRYRSKSEGTLEDAHRGNSGRNDVNDNLRLEHHTSFETQGVAVEGRAFEEFLEESVEFRFVRWVVRDLLYEIRETSHRNDLDRLYDAIPAIDRAELNGAVSLRYTEEGEEIREQQSFDVVLRDRMGNPLIVANLNDSRREATEEMMSDLVENASRLRESADTMAAAFLVTSSYFEPGALELAAEETGSGLLRRSKRKSFVKLSRKRGYHLCLVESRNSEFHVTVPEL